MIAKTSIPAESATAHFMAVAGRLAGPWNNALEPCIPVGRQAVRDNFTSSASPDDMNWPPRKDPGDGHPLLIDKGNLLQAAIGGAGGIVRVDGNVLEMGVSLEIVPYARAHNLGNPDRNLPQREFLGLRLQRQQEAETIIADVGEKTLFG